MNGLHISTRRMSENLVQQLTEKINSGEIPKGSLLPSERQLAETFGASRSVVREAMVALQASGLISIRSSRRAIVTQLDNTGFFNQLTGAAQSLMARPNGMSDFQEARTLFECGMSRHAARYASPKEIERLRVALEQNKKAVDDPELFAKTGLEFHRILAEIPGNGIFTACHSAMAEWMVVQRKLSLEGRTPEMSVGIYKRREAVYDAIAARDVEAADKAMSEHLAAVNQVYWQVQEAVDAKAG
ncbi:MAG: FCD domain-containing protein [Gammaproteobacteria bacterium]|nr:MAG: FCD domain-containing protein [Gammaproteobacteria bacterium]